VDVADGTGGSFIRACGAFVPLCRNIEREKPQPQGAHRSEQHGRMGAHGRQYGPSSEVGGSTRSGEQSHWKLYRKPCRRWLAPCGHHTANLPLARTSPNQIVTCMAFAGFSQKYPLSSVFVLHSSDAQRAARQITRPQPICLLKGPLVSPSLLVLVLVVHHPSMLLFLASQQHNLLGQSQHNRLEHSPNRRLSPHQSSGLTPRNQLV